MTVLKNNSIVCHKLPLTTGKLSTVLGPNTDDKLISLMNVHTVQTGVLHHEMTVHYLGPNE